MAFNPKRIATDLFMSLSIKPQCDHVPEELTPEQVAALHAHLHEVMASFYRLSMVVPQPLIFDVLNRRFAQALGVDAQGS
jgi:hypothetical protein